jgi:membrane protein implicated in regulation of membrane protease activity
MAFWVLGLFLLPTGYWPVSILTGPFWNLRWSLLRLRLFTVANASLWEKSISVAKTDGGLNAQDRDQMPGQRTSCRYRLDD